MSKTVKTIGEAAAAGGRGAGAVSSSRLRELVAQYRARALSAEDAMRAAQRGEPLDLLTQVRLKKTPGVTESLPETIPASVAPQNIEPRPFANVGGQLVSDADPTVTVRPAGDGETFVYPDGVVVDVNGNVVGQTAVDDLTDTGGAAQADSLDASATDLGGNTPKRDGRQNLTPNTRKVDAAQELAGSIWAATTPQDTEAVSQRTLKQLLNSARKYRNADGTYDPDFLSKINRDPAEANARLQALEQMAGVSNADRAAEQIDTAAQARAAASIPRPPAGNRPATAADFQAAKELAGETLPAGDWNALTAAFNKMDDDQRQAVLAALPSDTRAFLSGMLDPSQPTPSFLPNLVAARTRPVNDVDDLISQRDAAALAGDTDTVATINGILQGEGVAPQDEVADAVRAVNERQAASTALRNALLGQDEMVRAEKARMQQAAIPQPQPAAVTPGARTPEFAAEEVPDAEMPTAFDEAIATANEARLARERRAVGGGLPLDTRLRAARTYLKQRLGVKPNIIDEMSDKALLNELPLFLKGNDNPIPFEVRSQGARAGYVSDAGKEAISDRIKLRDNVNAAHAALDAVEGVGDWRQAVLAADSALQKAERSVKNASGAASLSRASQKAAAAREAYIAALQSNPNALAASRAIDAAYAEMDKAGSGHSLSDRQLNRGGPAQTYSEVVAGMTGFRNPEARSMNRSSVDLTARERAALVNEADRNFGDDADELLDDAPSADDEINLSEGGGRKSRLGGGHPDSRAIGSAQAMFHSKRFGQFNPMEMINPDTGLPLFESESAVAKEILSRDSQYPAGSEAYGVASDDIADIIRRHYSSGATRSPVAVPHPQDARFIPDEPDATVVLDDATSSPVINNLESSATEISDDTLDPVAVPVKSKRGGKKATAKPQPAADGSPVQPVSGNAKTVEEIQAEANEVERETRRQALDDGYEQADADQIARTARKKHVDAEMAARKAGGVNPVEGNPSAVDSTPPATPSTAQNDSPIDPVAGDGPVRLADEDQMDLPETPKDTDASKPQDGEGTTGDLQPKPPTQKKGLLRKAAGWLKYPAIISGVLTGGGIVLDRLGRSDGAPPGGGGGEGGGAGGGPGGGDFFPIPAGSDGATLMDADAKAAEEERLNSVLDRIRGRPTVNQTPTFQTLQNYNGWR